MCVKYNRNSFRDSTKLISANQEYVVWGLSVNGRSSCEDVTNYVRSLYNFMSANWLVCVYSVCLNSLFIFEYSPILFEACFCTWWCWGHLLGQSSSQLVLFMFWGDTKYKTYIAVTTDQLFWWWLNSIHTSGIFCCESHST